MTINRILVSICVFVALLEHGLAAYPERSVPARLRIVSPDRRYSVELVEIDRQWRYVIKEIQTGQLDSSIVMPTVLLYLEWSANSKSIVAVEHIPKGSCGRVIYLKNGKWRDIEVRPPGEERIDSAIVRLEIKPDHVHYKFAVRRINDNGMPIDYKFCDLDVELQTGRISNVNWTPTSERGLAASLRRKPSYVPPMKER